MFDQEKLVEERKLIRQRISKDLCRSAGTPKKQKMKLEEGEPINIYGRIKKSYAKYMNLIKR